MGVTPQDVLEGYFLDYNNRLARQNAEAAERDQSTVTFAELAEGAGQIALTGSVEFQQ